MIDAAGIAQNVISIVDRMHELRRPQTVPTDGALHRVIEEVFWSSMDRYEGNPLQARIFFVRKLQLTGARIIQLASPRPISKDTIRQLSPAHAPDGALLAVEDTNGEPQIEAVLGSFPSTRGASPYKWLGVESRGPGSVRLSIGGWQTVLEFIRGTWKPLGGMSLDRTAAEILLMKAGLFPTEPAGRDWQVAKMILDIGNAIEHHGMGGALWILPCGATMDGDLEGLGHRVEMSSMWCEPFREMWELRTSVIRLLNPGCGKGHEFLQEAAQQWDFLRQDAVTRSLSSLTKIDGAIVINGSPQVLAFGVICNGFDCKATEVRRSIDPSNPSIADVVDSSVFGGSRHRSAIDFCSSHSPAGAVVASHDGGLTVFASWEKGRVIGSQISLILSDAEV